MTIDDIYSTARGFEVWLYHDIYIYIYIYIYIIYIHPYIMMMFIAHKFSMGHQGLYFKIYTFLPYYACSVL